MFYKFLAATFLIALLSLAQATASFEPKLQYLSAETTVEALGDPLQPNFTGVTFNDFHKKGEDIQVLSNTMVKLGKGVYNVQFTGTFRSISFPASFDLAFLIDGNKVFINTGSVDSLLFDNAHTYTIQKIIRVKEQSQTLEVITKDNDNVTGVFLGNRNLSIIKIR